jgi:hypothetical protein
MHDGLLVFFPICAPLPHYQDHLLLSFYCDFVLHSFDKTSMCTSFSQNLLLDYLCYKKLIKVLRFCVYVCSMYKGQSESNLTCPLFHAIDKLDMQTFHRNLRHC